MAFTDRKDSIRARNVRQAAIRYAHNSSHTQRLYLSLQAWTAQAMLAP
jgi:hypothetical protein